MKIKLLLQYVPQPMLGTAPSLQKLNNKPVQIQKSQPAVHIQTADKTTQASSTGIYSNIITTTTAMPSIAVTPSLSIEAEEYNTGTIQRKPKALSTAKTDIRRKSAEPIIHIYSNM